MERVTVRRCEDRHAGNIDVMSHSANRGTAMRRTLSRGFAHPNIKIHLGTKMIDKNDGGEHWVSWFPTFAPEKRREDGARSLVS